MEMEEAVERAASFLVKSGYPFYKLLAVKFDSSKKEWNVKFDVGAVMTKNATVIVDDATGRIISYERT